MRMIGDLERIDRVTLRAWRVANLAGWWLVGAVTYNGLALLFARTFVQRFAFATVGSTITLLVSAAGSAFAAWTAGWIVGRRIYRWPGTVAVLTVVFPVAVLILLIVPKRGVAEFLVGVAYAFLPAIVAGLTARFVWLRRPVALRAAG